MAMAILASLGTLTAGSPFLPLSLDQALVLAAKNKRPVFIDFCTPWCGACKRLDQDTWSNGKVVQQLKANTIPLKLDADQEPKIRDKYKVAAYPTLLFLNADGSILARIVGYQIPTQFIATLQGVVAGRTSGIRDRKVKAERP